MHTHTFKHTHTHIMNNTHDPRRRPLELVVGCESVQATAKVTAVSSKNITVRSLSDALHTRGGAAMRSIHKALV